MTDLSPLQTRVEAGIAWLVLNRPQQRNALDIPTLEALHVRLDACERDPAVRAVVLGGSGRSFCAGADLAEWAAAEARGELESYGWTEAAHGITQQAPVLLHWGPVPVSNAMVVSWIVTLAIVFMARAAAGKVALVPKGMQNFFEFTIETLYETLEGIMGAHLTRRTFWFFASVFLFILFSNWAGLIPLVGNLTVEGADGHRVGLLRAVNCRR